MFLGKHLSVDICYTDCDLLLTMNLECIYLYKTNANSLII